ncbi:N-acetyltransferase [Pseudomonas brassicacearum]|uniref:GNAT family N-acetyltransferase n=1 Tax=Pseudomonas brassicacearum TaxID=930166 RepID=A0A423GPZ9_9PSED|nr:GNAT family N-acetyltransferase [Pseudomonas brassicacearum]ROM95444.1 GNAT family N-acetyltransferase [Pseudomonas brassicacearum]
MKIIQCGPQQLDEAAYLFNQYRMFYEQADDLATSYNFIKYNLDNEKSKIYLVLDDSGKAVAFAQLYPTLCSLAMKPFYWLYDLYVDQSARKQGYARHLMNYLSETLKAEGAQRLSLDTAISNKAAQALYESLGYEQEKSFITYHKFLNV